jgi:hypothetical protein
MTNRGRGNARRSAQATDADEAMEDARAEVDDVAAAVETGESSAAAARAPAQVPSAVLQRRLDKAKADANKAKSDTGQAIKEKEAMQKQMDDTRAALALAKSNVGDAVQVAENPVATPARKVCLVPIETGFDLALNLDVCVIYLIQIFHRGRKRWQLQQFRVYPFLRKAASSLSSQVLARPTFVIFKKSWFPESSLTQDSDGTISFVALKCYRYYDS